MVQVIRRDRRSAWEAGHNVSLLLALDRGSLARKTYQNHRADALGGDICCEHLERDFVAAVMDIQTCFDTLEPTLLIRVLQERG